MRSVLFSCAGDGAVFKGAVNISQHRYVDVALMVSPKSVRPQYSVAEIPTVAVYFSHVV